MVMTGLAVWRLLRLVSSELRLPCGRSAERALCGLACFVCVGHFDGRRAESGRDR